MYADDNEILSLQAEFARASERLTAAAGFVLAMVSDWWQLLLADGDDVLEAMMIVAEQCRLLKSVGVQHDEDADVMMAQYAFLAAVADADAA